MVLLSDLWYFSLQMFLWGWSEVLCVSGTEQPIGMYRFLNSLFCTHPPPPGCVSAQSCVHVHTHWLVYVPQYKSPILRSFCTKTTGVCFGPIRKQEVPPSCGAAAEPSFTTNRAGHSKEWNGFKICRLWLKCSGFYDRWPWLEPDICSDRLQQPRKGVDGHESRVGPSHWSVSNGFVSS